MTDKILTMMAVGDLVLELPEAETYFVYAAPVLKSADVVVGQGEVVFTDRGFCASTDVTAPACDPKNISALNSAGFNVIFKVLVNFICHCVPVPKKKAPVFFQYINRGCHR